MGQTDGNTPGHCFTLTANDATSITMHLINFVTFLNQLTPRISTSLATPRKPFSCVGSGLLSLSSLIGG